MAKKKTVDDLTKSEQYLMDRVELQIMEDVRDRDLTAIDGLLGAILLGEGDGKYISTKKIKELYAGYLRDGDEFFDKTPISTRHTKTKKTIAKMLSE